MNVSTSKARRIPQGYKKKKTKNTQKNTHTEKDEFIKKKIQNLNNALDEDPVNVDALQKLMLGSHGCVTNDLRCRVWPKLLSVNIFEKIPKESVEKELEKFQNNKWWNQVNLDVNRSQRRFPKGIRISRRTVLQKQLTAMIMRVLCRNENLSYYQGYHDIAVTLLQVVGEDLGTLLLEQISKTYLRDYMDKDMTRTNTILSTFYGIISLVDKDLELFLRRAEVGTIFSLSWLITWYAHDISSFEIIVRLFDVFIASHPIMPIYFAVELVRNSRGEILQLECEMPFVHHKLSRLPSQLNTDNVEIILKQSFALYKQHPPDSIKYVRSLVPKSDSLKLYAMLLYNAHQQRPDTILRKRKKQGLSFQNNTQSTLQEGIIQKQVAPIVRAGAWAVTFSMGVMAFIVINTSKYW